MRNGRFAVAAVCGVLLATGALAQTGQQTESKSGLDLGAIDKSANPCDNFYQYACGNWMKNNPIPADESSWSTFNQLYERNQKILRGILEESEKDQSASSLDQKIGGFYQSCMDESVIEERGTAPLQSELERISRIANQRDLLDEVSRLHDRQIAVFFNFYPSPDPKNAEMTIANLDQGGIGLPERDFYFRTDAKSEEIRNKYVQHIAKMFELLGVSEADARKKASTVMSIETDLAKASLDVTSRRDPQRLVHIMPKAELVQLSPNFDFDEFFVQVKTPAFSSLNVDVPNFLKAFSALVANRSMPDLRDYMTWQYVSGSARLLPKRFVDENFNFYG